MAAATSANSALFPRNQEVLTVPTHITETTKVLKDNGETVEIVTVTLGSPSGSLKSGKSVSFAANAVSTVKAVNVSETANKADNSSNVNRNTSLSSSTASHEDNSAIAADDLIISSNDADNGITLLSSNSLATVLVDDGQASISENMVVTSSGNQFVQVVEEVNENMMDLGPSSQNINGK